MKTTNYFLSLIVPLYRQEKTCVKNIRELKNVLDTIPYKYEIIAVVDGNIDASCKKLKRAKIAHVSVLDYEKHQGKAFAIRFGMNRAKGDYVMFIDAGMEIDPSGIAMLIQHLEWYDAHIIVGSKRHAASMVYYPLSRKILSFGYYYLVKLLFGIKVHDTQAGIKIFRRDILQKILPKLVEKKFAGDLEMLVAANHLGFKRIYEAPIRLDYRFSNITSAATLGSIWGILIDTVAIFYRLNILKYYNDSHK